jgi:hypothetical protein
MNLPDGRLLKSRVVDDPRYPLVEALDRDVTGYAVLEPQETLLLESGGRGVLTFREGVPDLAYYTGTDRGGPASLGDMAMPGPYHVELYEFSGDPFDGVAEAASLRVPPGMPAERLAGDPALAASTRRAAPDGRVDPAGDTATDDASDADTQSPGDQSAVEAFLDDEEKIEAIRDQARREAEARAAEWGFD